MWNLPSLLCTQTKSPSSIRSNPASQCGMVILRNSPCTSADAARTLNQFLSARANRDEENQLSIDLQHWPFQRHHLFHDATSFLCLCKKLLDGNIRPGNIGRSTTELLAFFQCQVGIEPTPPAPRRSNPVLHHVQPLRLLQSGTLRPGLVSFCRRRDIEPRRDRHQPIRAGKLKPGGIIEQSCGATAPRRVTDEVTLLRAIPASQ